MKKSKDVVYSTPSYTIIITEEFKKLTGLYLDIDSITREAAVKKLGLRVVATRPPKKGEWFLRPSGRRRTFILEIAKTDFAHRNYLIIE